MSVTEHLEPRANDTSASRRGRMWLAIICVLFVALRLPVALRQIPGQDEDYFAVPGLTVLREGIPRIPYMPSRNAGGAFYKADEMLFALPPLYFYLEAAMYLVTGPSTAAARGVSLMCGVAAIVAVYGLARVIFRSPVAGLWSAGLYGASRIVYFPALVARPDMLCGAIGLGVLLTMWQWNSTANRRWLVFAGLGIGLGMLSHPFAVVYALQSGVWSLLVRGRLAARLGRAALLTGVAVVTFALWGLLIVQHPDAFVAQFFNNVVDQSGPGLGSRLAWPLPSFAAQIPLLIEHAGPWQSVVMLSGLVAAAIPAVRKRERAWQIVLALSASAIYLHIATVGAHVTKGYWCYTGGLLFVCAGGVIARFLSANRSEPSSAPERQPPSILRFRIRAFATGVVACAVMLPGAGLRTLVAHFQHWNDVNYDAPRFTRELISAVPADAKLVVDPGYIFDFYCAGRDVTLALDYDFFFSVRNTPYDFVVAGPHSLRYDVPQLLRAERIESFGDAEDLFACYSEIYGAPGRIPGNIPEIHGTNENSPITPEPKQPTPP